MTSAKKASTSIPYCKNQNMPYLTGAGTAGVSMQYFRTTMPSNGVIVFAQNNATDMLDGRYVVQAYDQEGVVSGKAASATRTATQFTLAGPSSGAVIDVVVIGQLKGQPAL
jgi:hypothetical protein